MTSTQLPRGGVHRVHTPVGHQAWLVTDYAGVRLLLDDDRLGRSHPEPDTAARTGDLVLLDVGAANHDPAVFADPQRVEVTGKDGPHLAFGYGARYCIGAPLARIELQTVFAQLIPRFPSMHLTVDPRHRPRVATCSPADWSNCRCRGEPRRLLFMSKDATVGTGSVVSPRDLTSVSGDAVPIPDPNRLVHLQFRRFAGCPICNVHLQSIVRRHDEIANAGIREVVVFHSTDDELRHYVGDLPFTVIGDPEKVLYADSVSTPRRAPCSTRGRCHRR